MKTVADTLGVDRSNLHDKVLEPRSRVVPIASVSMKS